MTLHLGHRNNEQQNEIREARKLLKERVRDDWDWPVLPAHRHVDSGRMKARTRNASLSDSPALATGGFRFHIETEQEQNLREAQRGLYFEPVEWRERQYSSAESDTEGVIDEKPIKEKERFRFKFEAPDSVGRQLSERHQARKRRRQKALASEMEWNDGFAHWTARRDAWCCAHSATEINASDKKKIRPVVAPIRTSQPTSPIISTAAAESSSATSDSPRSSTSTAPTTASTANTTVDGALSSPSSKEITSEQQSPHSDSTETASSVETITNSPKASYSISTLEVLIPVIPTILPNHPIRRRITPSMYSEIYSKIILQSRTPSVPINLLTLISALVKGWKDDGEWPPKAAGVPEPSIGRKKKDSNGSKSSHGENALKSGVKAVGRVLRLSTS